MAETGRDGKTLLLSRIIFVNEVFLKSVTEFRRDEVFFLASLATSLLSVPLVSSFLSRPNIFSILALKAMKVQ